MASKTNARVTFREIAAKAGVCAATVSLALRNSPEISEEVRKRIQDLAERMGYTPNPLLAAYQASVRAGKQTKFQAVLGWINDWPESNAWEKPWMKPIWEGAQERAGQLGFQLEQIWIPEIEIDNPAGNAHRFQKILMARGIRGVILPQLFRPHHAALPWEGFSVVSIGNPRTFMAETLKPLPQTYFHHRVVSNYLHNMQETFRPLKAAGYRRIGLVSSIYTERETNQAYSSALARYQWECPVRDRIPLLVTIEKEAVKRWLLKYRPDAVIVNNRELLEWVREAGFRVPQQVRVIHMGLASDVADWSGIDRRLPYLGVASVDLLSAHLIRNETGVPAYVKEIQIEGVWVEGKT